jgi:hypothetical protein
VNGVNFRRFFLHENMNDESVLRTLTLAAIHGGFRDLVLRRIGVDPGLRLGLLFFGGVLCQ